MLNKIEQALKRSAELDARRLGFDVDCGLKQEAECAAWSAPGRVQNLHHDRFPDRPCVARLREPKKHSRAAHSRKRLFSSAPL